MVYVYSNLDNKNLKWFPNDTSRATLLTIKVFRGQIRGLKGVTIDFHYPITAIAGRNGSCKTTVLALSACAFHNESNGFKLPGRKPSYYTFSDFFIQTKEESQLGNIIIGYQILYNSWRIMHKQDGIIELCVLLDGDQESKKSEHIRQFLNSLEKLNDTEKEEAKEWVEKRLIFLPGNDWPESWIIQPKSRERFYERFHREFQMSNAEVDEMLDSASRAGKHNEFYEAAKILNLDDDQVVASQLVKSAFESEPEESKRIINFMRGFLGERKI